MYEGRETSRVVDAGLGLVYGPCAEPKNRAGLVCGRRWRDPGSENPTHDHLREGRSSMALPEQGQVLGIDVGWASTRETTGFCALSWDARVVRWSCAKTGKSCEARAQASGNFWAIGGRSWPSRWMGHCDQGFNSILPHAGLLKALSRGRFQSRGKPGQRMAGAVLGSTARRLLWHGLPWSNSRGPG
jgi:hypothetical protein